MVFPNLKVLSFENGARVETEVSQLVCVCVCVPVPERKVRGLLCSVFYCSPACNWARLLIAVEVVGGAVGVARHPAAVSWEAGSQGRSWSAPWGLWGPANCHLFLLTLHTWGSRRCRHTPSLFPPHTPPPPHHPSSLTPVCPADIIQLTTSVYTCPLINRLDSEHIDAGIGLIDHIQPPRLGFQR